MAKKRQLYPGIAEAEAIRDVRIILEDELDFIGGAPNYEKFAGLTPEEVLIFLNID